jgi:ABC-type transport system substrate-binding protein
MTFVRRQEQYEQGGFQRIRHLVVDDMGTQWLMFLKGEIDLLGEISRDNWDCVVGEGNKLDQSLTDMGIKMHSMPTLEVMYLGVNMRDSVLGGNRKLRQALNAAFDFPAWSKFYNQRILQCDGPVPPGVEGRLGSAFNYAYDLEKARRLIAEAGYPGGIDPRTSRRLTLTLSIGRASQESREAGELTAAFYEKIGIKLELQFMTWDAFLRAVTEGRVQLYRMGWVGDYPDAQNFLQLFHSRNLSPGPNRCAYVNVEFDREYDAALAATSKERRQHHWHRCQEIIREDCPWVFTHFNMSHSLVRPRVGAYVPSDFPYGQERFYRVKEAK